MIDLHCHILPGVDDGPAELEQALEMARLAVADGTSTLVATPHLWADYWERPGFLRAQTAAFQERAREAGLPLEILPGAEIPGIWEALKYADTLPRLGEQNRYLLLEVPLVGLPTYFPELVFALQVQGVQPVLAHPERSQLAQRHPEILLQLAERGCPLQINADSVTGGQGRAARALAGRFLREVEHCVLGSDAHDPRARPPLLSPARKSFRALGGEERFRQVTEEYPRRILQGEKL